MVFTLFMPNRYNNWTYKQVVRFLRNNGFHLARKSRGSHEQYKGYIDNQVRICTVPKHGSKAIHSRTMRSIIRQSGIHENQWFDET